MEEQVFYPQSIVWRHTLYLLMCMLIDNHVCRIRNLGTRLFRLIECTLQWRQYQRDDVSNHRRLDCLFNRLFKRWSKKTSQLRVTGLCEGNSPVTGEFPAQKWPETRKVFSFDNAIMLYDAFMTLWRHHDSMRTICVCIQQTRPHPNATVSGSLMRCAPFIAHQYKIY